MLECRAVDPDDWCHSCGGQGIARGTVTRPLAHERLGWRPTTLMVRVRRYKCSGCGRVWRYDISKAARPRAKISRHWPRLALEGIVCQHLTVARVAEGPACPGIPRTARSLPRASGCWSRTRPGSTGVAVIGVDEHVWRHTRRGDKYVTVIIDLTPVRERTGPARLLDMVEGRSKQVFKAWLAERPKDRRAITSALTRRPAARC